MNISKMYQQVKDTPEQAEKIIKSYDCTLEKIKMYHPDMYNDIKEEIYIDLYGYHFNEELLNEALECLINDDGSNSPKWTLDQTDSVASGAGFNFNKYNNYDYCYVMNMLYSDYCKVLGDSYNSYAKMTDKFLNDKDAPEGKALRYYMSMK